MRAAYCAWEHDWCFLRLVHEKFDSQVCRFLRGLVGCALEYTLLGGVCGLERLLSVLFFVQWLNLGP